MKIESLKEKLVGVTLLDRYVIASHMKNDASFVYFHVKDKTDETQKYGVKFTYDHEAFQSELKMVQNISNVMETRAKQSI